MSLTLQDLLTVFAYAFVARIGWSLGRRLLHAMLGIPFFMR